MGNCSSKESKTTVIVVHGARPSKGGSTHQHCVEIDHGNGKSHDSNRTTSQSLKTEKYDEDNENSVKSANVLHFPSQSHKLKWEYLSSPIYTSKIIDPAVGAST